MRRLFLIPILIVAGCVIIFILAGTPIVLDYTKRKIEIALTDATGTPLTISRLRGNLFHKVHLEDIRFASAVQIEKLMVSYNPFRLLAREIHLRSIKLTGLHVDLDRIEEITGNLPEKSEEKTSEASAFAIRIREFSIEKSGVLGKLGSTPVTVSLITRGSMMRDRVIIDSLRLTTGQSWVLMNGTIPLGEQSDLAVEYNMAVAAEDLGMSGLSGEMHSQGSIGGKFPAIELRSLTQLAISYLQNDLNGIVELQWRLPEFRHLQVDAHLQAKTKSLRREVDKRDSMELNISLENSHLHCGIRSNLGNLRIAGNLKEDFTKPYFRGTLEGDFDYLDFEPSFAGHLYYGNDSLELSDFALVSRRVAMDLSLLFNAKTREISSANVDLSCSDLSVWNTFISAPTNMAGKLWCNLSISGSLDDPEATAKLIISDARIYTEQITGVNLDLSLSDGVVYLDTGLIHNDRGEIVLAGSYDFKNQDFVASLYSDGLVFRAPEVFGSATLPLSGTVGLDLKARGSVHVPRVQGEIFVNDFTYDTLTFGNHRLECRLDDDTLQFSLMNIKEDLILDATLVLGGFFPCVADLKLQHFILDKYIAPATGYITSRISARGALARLKDAIGTVQIDTVKLLVEQQTLENVGPVIAHLKDRLIHLRTCEFIIARQNLYASGSIPLEFDSQAMDITARSAQIQLANIAYLLPRDPAISGLLRFDLRVQGTPKALDIDGMLSVTEAQYKLGNVIVDSVNGVLKFRNGLVRVDSLTGKVNKGRFVVAGFADVSRGLLDTALLDIELDHIDYANKDFGYVVCSADLQAGAKQDTLWISGEMVIDEAAYTAPMNLQIYVRLLTSANRPAPQQPEISKRIYCDVGITVPDSIVIANNVANLAVRADMQLKGYLARLNVYGTIAATDEGTIQYLGKKFTIVNAVIQFDDPYKIDPVIDLMATSKIIAADGDYEIYLHLNGTATTWQLGLHSNPSLPEQDIVSLLLIGQRRPGAVGGVAKDLDLKGKVKDYALDMVRHNIEKTTQEILGLDEFTLTGDLSDPATMRIGIEKSITEGFKLHYSTGVESWELYQVGASYDLTDKISIFTLYDQENRNTSVDLEYHIKIR